MWMESQYGRGRFLAGGSENFVQNPDLLANGQPVGQQLIIDG